MDNAFFPINRFFPGKIVMVLNHVDRCSAQLNSNLFMDYMMAGRSVVACKIHGFPVFYSFFLIKGEPCQVSGIFWERSLFLRQLRIMISDSCSQSPGS